MKNILKIVPLILLTIFLNSCNDDNDITKVSYPEISGIGEELMLIKNENAKFELSGGDEKFTVEISDNNIADISVKDKMLTIDSKTAGITEITIKSADKIKIVKLNVTDTPEAGVYMDTKSNIILKNSVKNSIGLWLVEFSGNPYEGKRVFISKLPKSLEKNKKIQITLKSFGIEGLNSGNEEVTVESLTQEIVKLKIGEYSIVVPRS